MRNQDYSILIRELKAGKESAFDSLFRLFYQDLCRFACSFLNDPMMAEDVVQGIFEKTGEIGGRHRNLGSQLVQRQRLHIVFVNVGRHRAEPVIVAIFLSRGGIFSGSGEGGAEKIDQFVNET